MPQKCVVPHCKNTSYKLKGVPFFKFPRNEDVRQRWLEAMGLEGSQLKHTATVCFAHFESDDYFTFSTKHTLKPTKVPRLNIEPPAAPAFPTPTSRAEAVAVSKTETVQEMDNGRRKTNGTKKTKKRYYSNLCGNPLCRTQALMRIEKVMHRNHKINYYTGVQNFQILRIIFTLVLKSENGPHGVVHQKKGAKETGYWKQHKLTPLNEFFLTLMKLRRGFDYETLADMFGISPASACRIFLAWVNLLYDKLACVKIWPHKNVLLQHAPEQFLVQYPGVIGSIYCTEFGIQTPSSLVRQSQCFSHYKGTTTVKGLIMTDPNGAIIFVSALFTGFISDKKILEESRFCDVLRQKLQYGELSPGDIILADKGFNVRELMDTIGITLNIPTFRITGRQFDPEDVAYSRTISHERIHVERAIRRLKAFSILSYRIPVSLLGSINQIYTVCALLTNFRYPLRK